LYRRTWLYLFTKMPGYDRLALMRRVFGPSIQTEKDGSTWLQNLPPAESRRAHRALAAAEFDYTLPILNHSFDDYREVATGCFMPFRQTIENYNLFDGPQPFFASRSEQTVTQVSVNTPLPDELFRIELRDGVKVATDWRYDPPIQYTYRKDQPESERA